VGSGATVEESVILGHSVIREGARVRRAILDHGTVVQSGDEIGYDHDQDRKRYFVDDESGIVVTGLGSYDDKLIIRTR
jgi:glucose-1-phosphate adenylyltransferase